MVGEIGGEILSFHWEEPGLSGDKYSVSFRSTKDEKYIYNNNGDLILKSFEQSTNFKKAASFNRTTFDDQVR